MSRSLSADFTDVSNLKGVPDTSYDAVSSAKSELSKELNSQGLITPDAFSSIGVSQDGDGGFFVKITTAHGMNDDMRQKLDKVMQNFNHNVPVMVHNRPTGTIRMLSAGPKNGE